MMSSCTSCSQSGQRAATPLEKVVVIESSATRIVNGQFRYKVKRIERGVSDYTWDINYYNPGDTILKRFPNIN